MFDTAEYVAVVPVMESDALGALLTTVAVETMALAVALGMHFR